MQFYNGELELEVITLLEETRLTLDDCFFENIQSGKA